MVQLQDDLILASSIIFVLLVVKTLETINLAVVVKAGYWLGSPNDVSYIFHQDLFVLWNSWQKEDA